MKFYLGIPEPSWLEWVNFPTFLSYQRIVRNKNRKYYPIAQAEWWQDSNGFMTLQQHGRYLYSPKEFAATTREHQEEIGNLSGASIQDYMCEPHILEATGKTVLEHQQLTIDSYLELHALQPSVNWIPVLQGFEISEYYHHVEMYLKAGIDLRTFKVVGIGSVCRRQHTEEIEQLMRELVTYGIKVHGFGFKRQGIVRNADILTSADSMAWSYAARAKPVQLPGCTHLKCVSCIIWAKMWREETVALIKNYV